MHSGDLAVMRDDGHVNIAGRIKDMIIRGGENIYPREIEEFLHTHAEDQRGAGDRRAGSRSTAKKCARGSGCATGATATRTSSAISAAARSPLQDSAVYPVHDRIPDDGHREVQKFRMREITVAELTLT